MTADTFSTDGVGVLLMGTGNDNNTWGDNANNSVFQILLDAITNSLTSSVTGGTLDLSGSPPPTAPSQVHYRSLIFNGTLGSNQVVQVPNLQKWWMVKNATSGAFTLTLKTPLGSASSAIPQNSGWQFVYCDGSGNIVVFPFNTGQIQMPDGGAAAPSFSNVNEPKSGWYRFGTQDWRFAINGFDVLQLTGTGATSPSVLNVLSPNALQVGGNVVVSDGATLKAADGTVSHPGLTFNSEPNSGAYRIGNGDVGFSVLQVLRAEITSTGFAWQGNTFAGSDLLPASISSNQNDYNPPGLGLVLTLGSITGGSGYVNGVYDDVPLTGGAGTGARATITVSGGAVSAVVLTKRGTGFVAANALSASNSDIGGTGAGFSVPVATVDSSTGTCLRLNVTATCSLTGRAGGSAGKEETWVNIGTATLKCPANSGSSSAANRLANTFNLAPGQSITLRYDATSSLWRPKNAATAVSSCAIASVSGDLKIVNNSTSPDTKLDITASEAVLTDGSGNAIKFENVSVTVDSAITGTGGFDTGTRGASKENHIYLVSDGVSIAAMFSLSATGPSFANATNYLYWKRLGARFTNASSNFLRAITNGRRTQYVVGINPANSVIVAGPGTAGSVSTPTWVAIPLSGIVPTTASHVEGFLSAQSGMVAPNNNYGFINSTTNPPPVIRNNGSVGSSSVTFDMMLESASIYWASSTSVGLVAVTGWSDGI
jgi:hypothetical protein